MSSTNKNTQIDLFYTNCSGFDCRYYENYFGYHKPIVGILNKPKENVNTNSSLEYVDEYCLNNDSNNHVLYVDNSLSTNPPIVNEISGRSSNRSVMQIEDKLAISLNSFVNEDAESAVMLILLFNVY